MDKERLDVLLVRRGFYKSRERAKSSIMAGVVYVDGQREDKPGTSVNENCFIETKENINPYVSRGGLKLEKAVGAFGINLTGRVAMDVGASTGGFTDCMLQNGAIRVYTVDVGYGQLAWSLRNDKRVVNMERTNIRYVKPEDLGEEIDFASIDVSFISLKKVLSVVHLFLNGDGEIVCLIKPQFEAGREKVGKRGVVRDPEVHEQVITDILYFSVENGFLVKGLTYSPVKGPEGNIEYLLYLSQNEGTADWEKLKSMASDIVMESHSELNKKQV